MEFWKTYFTIVDVLKQKVALYEALIAQTPELVSETASPKGTSRTPFLSSKSVLIIEPLERNRVLISRYFDALSLKVEFAKTEEDAAVKKQNGQYDVMINTTGMNFPVEKITLIERLKASLN